MTAIPSELSDEQIIAALAVEATASGAAALLSNWHERTVTAEDVLRHVTNLECGHAFILHAFCIRMQFCRGVTDRQAE